MPRIASFLGISETDLFTGFLMIDYVLISGKKLYYVCPARKSDQPGRIVTPEWTFSNSPCIFLRKKSCAIEKVKPQGGKAFYCRFMTRSNRNFIGYGKKMAAEEWRERHSLNQLLAWAANGPQIRSPS